MTSPRALLVIGGKVESIRVIRYDDDLVKCESD